MKKNIGILLIIMMALTLVACNMANNTVKPSEEEDTRLQVGIVLPTKDETRWLQDEASFSEILGKAGFTSEILFSQGSSEVEMQNVESLIKQGVKVLVICPHDASAAGAVVQKAKAKGAKVICYDRLITDTNAVDYYVTFNSYDVGVKQGQYLIDAFAGKKDVPLYLYSGNVNENNSYIFFAGAWSVLSKAVDEGQFKVVNCPLISDYVGKVLDETQDREAMYTIMSTINTGWDFNTAKTLAQTNLLANKASDKGDVAVLAPNDDTARAIADALAQDGNITSWVITGQDADSASIEYIEAGKQSMTIWKNTTDLAQTTFEMINAILAGETVSTSTTYYNGDIDVPASETPVTIITRTNTSIVK